MHRAPLARARSLAVVVPVLLALACCAGPGGALAKKKTPPVHLRGTVYTFDTRAPIVGATVGLAELPGATAQSGPDGRFDLVVPDGTKFTPYADAAGHHRIYLQTFVSQGKDLEHVNFQVPTAGAYNLLALILGAPRDANDELLSCAVVSTFSTVNVRDLSFEQFIAYGAHGVAGATATASPKLPEPVYFNDAVIPDVSLTESSVDGGVAWPIVPSGVVRFAASHATTRFARFRATCAPGRVVNASPPHGFYELRPGEAVDTTVKASLASPRFDLRRKRPRLRARVAADEYVAVRGRVLAGKRVRAKRRTKGFARGKRSLILPVDDDAAGKIVTLELTVEDAAGNVQTLTRKLRVPTS